MTNDATRATAEAMPKINRRLMLAAAAATAACGLAAVEPAAAATMPSDALSELRGLIEVHRKEWGRFVAALDAEDESRLRGEKRSDVKMERDSASDAETVALEAVLSHRCASMSEISLKADYIAKALDGCAMDEWQVDLLISSMRQASEAV